MVQNVSGKYATPFSFTYIICGKSHYLSEVCSYKAINIEYKHIVNKPFDLSLLHPSFNKQKLCSFQY